MKNLILILTLILFFISSNVGAQGQFVDVGLHANFTGYNLIFAYSKKVGKSEFSLGLKYLFKNEPGKYDQKGLNKKFYPDQNLEHWGISLGYRRLYPIKGTTMKLGWFDDFQFTNAGVDMTFIKNVTADTFVFENYQSNPIKVFSNTLSFIMEIPISEDVLFTSGIGAGINVWKPSKSSGTLNWYLNWPTVFAAVKVNLDRFKKH